MNAIASIHGLEEVLGDDGLFPARMGHKDPSAPSFIYFDDENELTTEERAFRDDLLAFEEWNAERSQKNTDLVKIGMFEVQLNRVLNKGGRVLRRKVVIEPLRAPECHSKPGTTRSGKFPTPSSKDAKRATQFTRKVDLRPITVEEMDVKSGYVAEELDEKQLYRMCQYTNLREVVNDRWNKENPRYDDMGVLTNPFRDIQLVLDKSFPVTHQEVRDFQETGNWHINREKEKVRTNDHWHKALKKLALVREDDEDEDEDEIAPKSKPLVILKDVLTRYVEPIPEDEPSGLPGVVVNPIPRKARVRSYAVPFAPKPVGGTKFVNETRVNVQRTKGTNPYTAKDGFIRNHGLTSEFVSVERVQYVTEKKGKDGRVIDVMDNESLYIVGRRKTSDTTPSRYYDPEPSWKDHEGGTYAPRACALFMVPPSMVMPDECHRLTVREFERALVAGAQCYDNEEDALIGAFESDTQAEGQDYFEEDDGDELGRERIADGRVSIMNYGNGDSGRHVSKFTHEEEYLYGILRMIGDEQGQELMTLFTQEENVLHRHIMADGWDTAVSIVKFVAGDAPEMLDYVKRAVFGDQEIHRDRLIDIIDSIPPIWETDLSVPNGEGGARLALWTKWKD